MEKIKKLYSIMRQFGIIFSLKYVFFKVTNNNEKYIKLIYKYVERFLEPLINEYNSREYAIPENSKAHERFHVWICWWQGEEKMPELCKICYQRLQQMLPSNADIHLITSRNFKEFIDIPKCILTQLEENKITITYFSDILRESLLAKYGGLWIDSTVYVSNRISEDYFSNYQFWSVKIPPDYIDKKYIGQEISKGKWCGFIMLGKCGNVLNSFVKDAMYLYAKSHDTIIDYFLQNLIIAIGYDRIPKLRALLDALPYNNISIYELYEIIDEEFQEDKWLDLTKDSSFFKLTWKRQYLPVTENGVPNFYSYLLRLYNEVQ